MRVRVGFARDRDARRLLVVVGVILLLMAGQPWLWGWVFDSATEFRNRQTQQGQLANVQRLTEQIRVVDPAQAALLEQAGVAFPLMGAAPQIVERLEGLAETQGLTMQLVAIREVSVPGRGPKLVPFDIDLTVAGAPRAVLAFVETVEHMQELTQVTALNMDPVTVPVVGQKVYRLSMTVRFFLQPAQ